MSKHNYSQYSNKKNRNEDGKSTVKKEEFLIIDDLVETPVVEASEVKMVVESVDTVNLPKMITGFVSDCAKLNVRVEPSTDADVICVLNNATEIEINLDNSTNEWFSICTAAGIEGYCMRKFVNAKL